MFRYKVHEVRGAWKTLLMICTIVERSKQGRSLGDAHTQVWKLQL